MMPLPVRLLLHLAALGLLVACLAYWWLGNLAHEIFGTLLFALLITHIAVNRRWYGAAMRGRYGVTRVFNTVTIAGLAVTMATMLVTSFLISRDVFAFASLDGAFGVREIHMFTAYWVVLIVSVHLGFRWRMVMTVLARMFGIVETNIWRSVLLKAMVAIIAVFGVRSCFEMTFGSKLMLTYTLDMWDFNGSTLGFFVNYGSIMALVAALAHYSAAFTRRRERLSEERPSTADAGVRRS